MTALEIFDAYEPLIMRCFDGNPPKEFLERREKLRDNIRESEKLLDKMRAATEKDTIAT